MNPGRSAGMSYFLPLSILDGEVCENPKSELWRIRNIAARHPLTKLRTDVRKSTIALFISEVLYRTLRDGTREDGLFEWCEGAILTLDALQDDFANFHLRFLLELSSALGFSPNREDILPFAGEHLREIEDLVTLPMADTLLLPLSGQARNEIAEALLRYLGYHAECTINVRSLPVLREIFKD